MPRHECRDLSLTWAGKGPVLWCADCKRRQRPALPEELEGSLARWSDQFESIYRLWLASTAYERWAARELDDLDSAINRLGRRLRGEVARATGGPCFYWWEPTNKRRRPQKCPRCDRPLARRNPPAVVREKCSVLVPKEASRASQNKGSREIADFPCYNPARRKAGET